MPSHAPFPTEAEYELPCAEALLGATMAVMTAHAQACCDQRRALLAQKAASGLAALAEHPAFSPGFRTAAGDLREHWQRMNDVAMARRDAAMHMAPATLQ